ncbi:MULTISPECIES: enoyl-CoA hydratase/isomerase family protein [Vitreoscilla]|uniref:3-hydroxyisobutyryl-CoA hydrolase n=1 Tax=Vitreoscilla stercoraria TaxID=61 RepID=A0ABY4EHT7_VITST|nr:MULTISPECIES: enoyl-CoA hydratase/isomerase family protein [Vitreoscilla]AUZ05635.2 3-hydroxyisobutyryl-CoA hydrolase [Vitreoscilla sp. C1]UOO92952.1 enoyl-CoA hydratase/isomerase family protein [Vitreoscilla stercoraria]
MSNPVSQAVVLSQLLPTFDGKHIGILSINRPKALNSLNLEVIQAMRAQLQTWEQDANIVAVWLEGNERALCAGGDIRALQQCVGQEDAAAQVAHFFQHEYGLYAYMAHYAKPIITWCSGIVMGGGLGLAAASTVRIVTETTQMAMPEISIGLFPDAGANAFLQKFPFKSGVFLGLSGARFNGNDAILGNLAEFAFASDSKERILQTLQQAKWHQKPLVAIKQALLDLPAATLPEGHLLAHQHTITQITQQATFQDALNLILAHRHDSDWMENAAHFIEQGCATSAALHWELMQKCRHLSLKDILNLEHTVATHCVLMPDFSEGVRALLIDKDKNPKWQKTAAEIDDAWLTPFFNPLSIEMIL